MFVDLQSRSKGNGHLVKSTGRSIYILFAFDMEVRDSPYRLIHDSIYADCLGSPRSYYEIR